MTETAQGIVAAFNIAADGTATPLDWTGVRAWKPADGFLWLHLHRDEAPAQAWAREESGFDSEVAAALLATETRPRFFANGDSATVILRGVNLNPGADPEDMVSLRLHVEESRVVSVRIRNLFAIRDMIGRVEAGAGPRNGGALLALVSDLLTARMETPIDAMDEALADLEGDIAERSHVEARASLRKLRHAAIVLRRYISPQRDVMRRLQLEALPWLEADDRTRIREVEDRLIRYVEDLEEVREKAAVLQDEISNRLAEESNRRMYALTIVASVMLPLSFVTGLLGVNVAGMPGAESKYAFWIMCGVLAVMAAGQAWLFRKLRWI